MSERPIEVSVNDVAALRESGRSLLLIDCREQDEWDTCRIDGAVLIPMKELPTRLGEIEQADAERVVVHCHHGGRSLRAAEFLRGNGIADVQSMAGGIDRWSLEIDSTVPRY